MNDASQRGIVASLQTIDVDTGQLQHASLKPRAAHLGDDIDAEIDPICGQGRLNTGAERARARLAPARVIGHHYEGGEVEACGGTDPPGSARTGLSSAGTATGRPRTPPTY